ncbi:MAG: spore cortex biosynthesis protein YabQ [Peptostreptococcaceae bacterium]
MSFFTEDLISFFATIYGGLFIGLCFDINRVMKNNLKIIKPLHSIFDIVFWFIVTLISFILINAVESFDLRYYHFIALFIGFLLYYKTISKFIFNSLNFVVSVIIKVFVVTFKYILKISEAIYYLLAYLIHLLYDILFLLPVLFSRQKRNKRVNNRIKFKTKKKV